MSNIHVINNGKIDTTDKFAKVHPLFQHFNQVFMEMAPTVKNHSVDEAMVPYYGRHGCESVAEFMFIVYGLKYYSIIHITTVNT